MVLSGVGGGWMTPFVELWDPHSMGMGSVGMGRTRVGMGIGMGKEMEVRTERE